MGKLWDWFRDSQRPHKRTLTRPLIPTTRDLTEFRPGRATKVPQVFHAIPADTYGTWRLETPGIRATYNALVRLLGQPNGHVSDKVTTEWVLPHDGGRFTIYDHKATSEYDEDLPSVSEFHRQSYNWHIGTDGSQEAARGASLVKKAVEQQRRSERARRRASRKYSS
jgi:hypothetical protein